VEEEVPGARRLIDSERRVHWILRARFADALVEMGVSFAQLEVMELLHEVEKTTRVRSVANCSSPDSLRVTSFGSSSAAASSRPGA
jgi:hypothetical protein